MSFLDPLSMMDRFVSPDIRSYPYSGNILLGDLDNYLLGSSVHYGQGIFIGDSLG